eukprot:788865-Pelagomonas_calceolata.AAC.8
MFCSEQAGNDFRTPLQAFSATLSGRRAANCAGWHCWGVAAQGGGLLILRLRVGCSITLIPPQSFCPCAAECIWKGMGSGVHCASGRSATL